MSDTDDWLMEIEAAALAAIENETKSARSSQAKETTTILYKREDEHPPHGGDPRPSASQTIGSRSSVILEAGVDYLTTSGTSDDDGICYEKSSLTKVVGEDVIGDNDEAEPSSMVDSALRGGSSKTSVESQHLSTSPICHLVVASSDTCSPTLDCLCPEKNDGEIAEISQNNPTNFEFDDWLSGITLDELDFQSKEIAPDVVDDFDGEPTIEKIGRKSAEDGKRLAFDTPMMKGLEFVYQPCNHLCPLASKCTFPISGKSILDLRKRYFGEEGVKAPKDKERAKIIMEFIRKARKDKQGNLIFNVDGNDVCIPAFLRILGVSTSADLTKAPGQWSRLIKGFLKDENEDSLLSTTDLEADVEHEFHLKSGHCKAFMNSVAHFFSDSLPAVTSEDGSTNAMQVPYGTIKGFYAEYVFHCDAHGIGSDIYASYQTFCRAYNQLHSDGILILLGDKSGFSTCALCNNVISIKKSACCKRDTITNDALIKLNRLHILQQGTERQHAENFIMLAKIMQNGQPVMAYFDIDGQSTWAGNTPKLSKDRSTKLEFCVENRNIGARIVCGPIDEYIAVCTNNLIPGGANVLIEVTRFCMEYLGKRLAEIDETLVSPKKIGLNFDNSGENKNKEMFCFISNLIESGYYDEIEVFFLIVGHTHNNLDQWFSVLSKAIKGAHFIGSVIALKALYKIAHAEEINKQPQLIHQLETYRDWRRLYRPIINGAIKHFQVPHRYKFKLDEQLGCAKMEYMHMSPPHGFKHLETWHPIANPEEVKFANPNGDISLKRLGIFNGIKAIKGALDIKSSSIDDIAEGDDEEDIEKLGDLKVILPVLRELEVRTIGESQIRMEEEAANGAKREEVKLTAAQLRLIDKEITLKNSNRGGRIVWLRHSQVSDPNYLKNTIPDILPNPKLWRERIANAPAPPTSEQSITLDAKIAKADAAESQQRLISYQRGAADMASTASYMIKLVESKTSVGIADHNDIVLATGNFKRSVLTPKEVAWYRSISTSNMIATATELRVLEEERKPWKLLNLPEMTPSQKKREEDRLELLKQKAIQVEKTLRGLVLRDGEGEYNPDRQVIAFDGFEPAKTQDLDKMTRPNLEALAKGYIKTTDMKKMKVDDLRKAVKKLIEDNPTLLQIPVTRTGTITEDSLPPSILTPSTTGATAATTTVGSDTQPVAGAVTEQCCSVLECSDIGEVWCSECELLFCNQLHGPHSSHGFQMIRSDRRTRKVDEVDEGDEATNSNQSLDVEGREAMDIVPTLPPTLIVEGREAMDILPTIPPTLIVDCSSYELLASTESVSNAASTTQCNAASTESVSVGTTEVQMANLRDSNKRAAETTGLQGQTGKVAKLVISLKLHDNVEVREDWESKKFEDAVEFVREQSKNMEPNFKEVIFKKFNYASCYDIQFLHALASEFNVDVSAVVSRKRVQPKEVLMEFISKLN